MPPSTLDVTPGGANANAYCTLAFANTYHDDRLHVSDWTGATDDTKNAAILWATLLLDDLFEWTGWAADPDTQRLLWPRSGMIHRSGESVDSATIPEDLQQATAEYARQLIAEDRAADSDAETQNLKRVTAGPVTIEFNQGVSAKVVPDGVVNMIPSGWYTRVRGRASLTRQLVRT
jgi:hypothetical protein